MTTQNPFAAQFSDAAEYDQIDPGAYNGVCIAGIIKEFADIYGPDPSKKIPKLYYVYQIALDGACTYVKTKPMKIILGEKSNLFLLLQSWFGCTLEAIHKKYENYFPCDSVVGKPAQLVLNMAPAKDGSGKEYLNLANVLKVRKGTTVPVTPDAIPAYLVRGAVFSSLAEGITVKEDTQKQDGVTAPAQAPKVQVGQKGASPSLPANAQVTQNTNAAAFMGVTNPAPQPAGPDAVTASQAMAAEGIDDDSDDSLPF